MLTSSNSVTFVDPEVIIITFSWLHGCLTSASSLTLLEAGGDELMRDWKFITLEMESDLGGSLRSIKRGKISLLCHLTLLSMPYSFTAFFSHPLLSLSLILSLPSSVFSEYSFHPLSPRYCLSLFLSSICSSPCQSPSISFILILYLSSSSSNPNRHFRASLSLKQSLQLFFIFFYLGKIT
ncbi:hypothetical protein ATANTOWER_001686 [Ataeniobius toweri]|uniref:Uncharacterized protein n=1 Tax=Ataeniobius toweri TaxID=208326 RepID=A0ABU7A3T4_9TELE|nr:hypothetical protein [Ataeniobius toweri]